jgi:hypothetical protein
MAVGGTASNEMIMLGDSASGAPTGNEELVVNPTGAPLGVVPNDAIPEGMKTAAAGKPDANELLQLIGQLIASMDFGGGEEVVAEEGVIPAAAEGGVFSNVAYGSDAIAGMPSLQKLAGNMNTSAFGGNMLDYSVPGSSFAIPQANRANIRTLNSYRPSEMATLQGVVETPRAIGGLGLDFGDYLTDAYRAAPTGATFGTTRYGG